MDRYPVFLLLCCVLFFAGCSVFQPAQGLSSYAYQEEAPNRVPGYNLYWYDPLDYSASQRVNQFNRSEFMQTQQQTFVQRVTQAQALDKAAQQLGREPGSLFRR